MIVQEYFHHFLKCFYELDNESFSNWNWQRGKHYQNYADYYGVQQFYHNEHVMEPNSTLFPVRVCIEIQQ